MKIHFNDITSNRASEPYVVIAYGMFFLVHGVNGQCSIVFLYPHGNPKNQKHRDNRV